MIRQGIGAAICAGLWGLLLSTFGVLHLLEGFGYRLLPLKTRQVVFVVLAALCLLASLLLSRRPTKS